MSNAAINLGTCWARTPDGSGITMPAVMVSGFSCVAQMIVDRWRTDRGGLIDDPNYGENVTDAVNDDIGPPQISRWQQRLGAEAEKDERVLRCAVTVTLTTAGVLMVSAQVTTTAGPFRMVVSIAAVTVTLLLVQPA